MANARGRRGGGILFLTRLIWDEEDRSGPEEMRVEGEGESEGEGNLQLMSVRMNEAD